MTALAFRFQDIQDESTLQLRSLDFFDADS